MTCFEYHKQYSKNTSYTCSAPFAVPLFSFALDGQPEKNVARSVIFQNYVPCTLCQVNDPVCALLNRKGKFFSFSKCIFNIFSDNYAFLDINDTTIGPIS